MDARNFSVYDELLDGRRVLLRAIRPGARDRIS
jgi:hypothetical protein